MSERFILPDLIHYGSTCFDPQKVAPIKNTTWVKPKGGFWASPINSNRGWKEWCEAEQFRDCLEENSFTFSLKGDSSVFVIDSLLDLLAAPLIKNGYGSYLDFEFLATKYDAIWLTEKGQWETHLSHPVSLYGWDCESVLILNPNCVVCPELLQERERRVKG